jgi:hypothetical protein
MEKEKMKLGRGSRGGVTIRKLSNYLSQVQRQLIIPVPLVSSQNLFKTFQLEAFSYRNSLVSNGNTT